MSRHKSALVILFFATILAAQVRDGKPKTKESGYSVTSRREYIGK